MSNSTNKIDPLSEIRRVLNGAEYRNLKRPAIKAAYFLLNYTSDVKFTFAKLACVAECSTSEIPKATWKLLCGYYTLDWSNPRYLAPSMEQRLCDIIVEAEKSLHPMTKAEILDMVQKYVFTS
jgi:hypothetical protein